ncbi:MAG: hypothetical protein PHE78_07855 [Candidatus Gastranaerophilales bacterium]|nr:hypothetical protein [Candidatus Gastranaerophilales bacterium]
MDTNTTTDSFKLISNYTSDLAADTFNVLGADSMIARSDVPLEHIKIADNFMLIKKLFGFSAVRSKITFEERKYLADLNLNVLEFSTMQQINEEILQLKEWSKSGNKKLQDASSMVMQIRSKELKYLIATSYRDITSENYNGFKALSRYFAAVTKY